jgi:FkbM family methyltransferase
MSNDGVTVSAQCRRGVFSYLPNDSVIGRSLELYGEYAEDELKLLTALIRPDDVVVDVGANIGVHAIAFAATAGRVIAIEAQRRLIDILRQNAAANGRANIEIIHAAAGAGEGMLIVPVPNYRGFSNFAALALGDHTDGESVPMLPLDRLVPATCRLIKIDVEGMELDVLQGAAATVARCRPLVYFEHGHDEPMAAPFAALFARWDYVCYRQFSPFFRPVNFRRNRDNVFGTKGTVNVLAIPREKRILVSLPPFA